MFESAAFHSRSPLCGYITQKGPPFTPFRRDDPLRAQIGETARRLSSAANVGAHRVHAPAIMTMADRLATDITAYACRTRDTPRRGTEPKPHFSRWTRLRAAFIASSSAMLRISIAAASARTKPVDSATALMLLKTIARLTDSTVRKLPNVNVSLTKEERWVRENIQSVARLLNTLSAQHGYATRSVKSVKRCLYERAETSVRHLKALADDEAAVAKATAPPEVFRL